MATLVLLQASFAEDAAGALFILDCESSRIFFGKNMLRPMYLILEMTIESEDPPMEGMLLPHW